MVLLGRERLLGSVLRPSFRLAWGVQRAAACIGFFCRVDHCFLLMRRWLRRHDIRASGRPGKASEIRPTRSDEMRFPENRDHPDSRTLRNPNRSANRDCRSHGTSRAIPRSSSSVIVPSFQGSKNIRCTPGLMEPVAPESGSAKGASERCGPVEPAQQSRNFSRLNKSFQVVCQRQGVHEPATWVDYGRKSLIGVLGIPAIQRPELERPNFRPVRDQPKSGLHCVDSTEPGLTFRNAFVGFRRL
jgi:hypothetical protein